MIHYVCVVEIISSVILISNNNLQTFMFQCILRAGVILKVLFLYPGSIFAFRLLREPFYQGRSER